ncbi:GNAT family N-acetyltransferase [Amycolatopsis acidiphila]|uniref:GNAT family N-acetyltransferase n=1 Tax=Amycolatopsis acidiphila TaxID=715473 RepID=A0A558AC06_9PSEU|nr:GNAT family N-acetyltransferase [Amycolatopsis acidiphila]TVT21798.1 GNAT family N-acetyltransferase [Amycolatopsis acidiphila]UIJ61518.1 GNAT family N-acetyltransferase [Amycolatopsis acidiphila]
MELRVTPYDHPDAVKLVDGVQQEYVVRYGDQDLTPVDPAEFALPHGLFLVGYDDGVPVACGGWRAHPDGLGPGEAEIKRMFVVESARGKGFARVILAELERTAAVAGHRRLVLETGLKQPEAIALYRSSGYAEITKFGYYREDELSLCFGKELTAG